MLSLTKCNQILNSKEKKYNDEQIRKIRDLLYQMARIEYELNKKIKANGCSYLHKSIN